MMLHDSSIMAGKIKMFVLNPISKQNTLQMIAFSAKVKPLGPSAAVFVLLISQAEFGKLRVYGSE